MKSLRLFLLIFVVMLSGCSKYMQDLEMRDCIADGPATSPYNNEADLQNALDSLVSVGIPGCAMAVYSPQGWWTGAAGYAKIEDRRPMQPCYLQYLQSVSKTYMAVAILKLYEQGKIDLDAPMTQYLPQKYSQYISNPGSITVRMLLNHTSGAPEYNFDPDYVAYLLQHPDHYFSAEDYLKFIDGKPLDFEPGSRYSYRNTNYVLLSLIADAISGDHTRLISEVIFEPLMLEHTFYRHEAGYPNYPELVNTYWDRHSDGYIENVSQMQRSNVAALVGDDGIVTTPVEAVIFLKGLLEGQLLEPATLAQMQTWVQDSAGNPRYGLGLGHGNIAGHTAIGHSGGGIGAGCELRYFPDKNLYVFVAINLGTVTDSPIHQQAEHAKDLLFEVLLK